MNFFEKIMTGRLFSRRKKEEREERLDSVAPETENVPKTDLQPSSDIPQKEVMRQPDLQPKSSKSKKTYYGPETIIKFFFMDKTYIVEDFDLSFKQDINTYKNRPDSMTYGGILTITLSEPPAPEINEWMMQTYVAKSGEIGFFPNKSKITDSALLTIYFFDAYCVKYHKEINTSGVGLLTTLTISPRRIKIGNEEFENNWKKKDNLPYYIKSI